MCSKVFSMSILMVAIFSMILLDNTVSPATNARAAMNGRKVVLMSMDGFRYDYLTKTHTPNFDRLLKEGVHSPYLNLTFTTLTFPSHYTIVTGLYEESHGIVGNEMYDPLLNESFTMGNNETRWWNGAEPIWINAVKSGLKVGTFFWVGSDVKLEGMRPTQWRKYDYSVPFESRVDTVIEWLSQDNFDLALIYFNEPDHTGHAAGPESPRMIPIIKRMDTVLGYFFYRLEMAGLKDKTDFILTSDHGMTTVYKDRRIYISDHANSTLVKRMVVDGAISQLIPQEGKDQELVNALSGVKNIKVYLKKDIPEHFHYKYNRRIMPVFVLADAGWAIVWDRTSRFNLNGTHGYSNELMDMKPILMAMGPSMASNVKADVVKSVDIYPLLCHLLHIEEAPNNGSFERIKGFLRTDGGDDAPRNTGVLLSIIVSSIIALIVSS